MIIFIIPIIAYPQPVLCSPGKKLERGRSQNSFLLTSGVRGISSPLSSSPPPSQVQTFISVSFLQNVSFLTANSLPSCSQLLLHTGAPSSIRWASDATLTQSFPSPFCSTISQTLFPFLLVSLNGLPVSLPSAALTGVGLLLFVHSPQVEDTLPKVAQIHHLISKTLLRGPMAK